MCAACNARHLAGVVVCKDDAAAFGGPVAAHFNVVAQAHDVVGLEGGIIDGGDLRCIHGIVPHVDFQVVGVARAIDTTEVAGNDFAAERAHIHQFEDTAIHAGAVEIVEELAGASINHLDVGMIVHEVEFVVEISHVSHLRHIPVGLCEGSGFVAEIPFFGKCQRRCGGHALEVDPLIHVVAFGVHALERNHIVVVAIAIVVAIVFAHCRWGEGDGDLRIFVGEIIVGIACHIQPGWSNGEHAIAGVSGRYEAPAVQFVAAHLHGG